MRDVSPTEAARLSNIRIIGQRELYAENYKRILKYSDTETVLALPGINMRITGEELVIRDIVTGAVRICGKIDGVSFLPRQDIFK